MASRYCSACSSSSRIWRWSSAILSWSVAEEEKWPDGKISKIATRITKINLNLLFDIISILCYNECTGGEMLEPLTELFSVMPVFMWVIGVGYCLAVAGVAAGLIMRGWGELWAILVSIGLVICLIGALAGLYATKYPLGGQNAVSILSSVFSFPITN